MMFKRSSIVFVVVYAVSLLVILYASGCSQYDYNSPQPGTLEIRLHTQSTNIPFDTLNNYILKVDQIEAVRDDGARASIYSDVKAIGRTSSNYNTLDFRAEDSSLVMGAAYLPPGNYVGVNFLVLAGTQVILDGYRIIQVIIPSGLARGQLIKFRRNFHIDELTTTRMVVTIDLDSTLFQGADRYYYLPSQASYIITSIQ